MLYIMHGDLCKSSNIFMRVFQNAPNKPAVNFECENLELTGLEHVNVLKKCKDRERSKTSENNTHRKC